MKQKYRQILILLILFTSPIVKGQNVVGYYVTPKISNGFFITKIAVYDDSTFYWNFAGDLIFEERKGDYIIKHKQLIFDLKPEIDTVMLYYKELDLEDIDTTKLPPLDPIIYDKNENIIKTYLIKRNKLIPISKEGKPVFKAKLVRISKEEWEKRKGMGIYKN